MNISIKKLRALTLLASSILGGSLHCMEEPKENLFQYLPQDVTRQITSLLNESTLGYDFSFFKKIDIYDFPFFKINVNERVARLVLSPDWKTVLIGSRDTTVRLLDFQTGKLLEELIGHTNYITSLAFSPNGKNVLTGSYDKTARLWNVTTGKQLKEFRGHTELISSVAYSPDGKTVLTGSADNTARLWDVETGKQLRELIGHTSFINSVAFSPDGDMIATSSYDNTVILWKRSPYFSEWRKRPESALKLGTEKELHKIMTPTGQSKL